MKTIKLLQAIPEMPAGANIIIKCKEDLKKGDKIAIPNKNVGFLKSEMPEKGVIIKDRKYIVNNILIDGHYICKPDIEHGNKATRINKKIPKNTILKVYES